MRRAEGASIGELTARQFTRDRMNKRSFQQFHRCERGQNGRQARGQHAFARTGRPIHEQIMPTSSGDFEREQQGVN